MKTERNLFVCLLLSLFLTACGGGGDSGNGGGGDGGGSVSEKKLLVREVTVGSGERTFQYDNQNRLVQQNSGTKIEYQDDDTRPSLIPSEQGYIQYQYGEDDLLNGVLTKYYQTQRVDQDKNPIDPSDSSFSRYYLDSNNREIASGVYDASSGSFILYSFPSFTYDDHGNLLKIIMRRLTGNHGPSVITVTEYTYDDEKSPMSGMATPPWWFTRVGSDTGIVYDHALTSSNNPLSRISTSDNGSVYSETYSYTYDKDGYPTEVDVTATSRDNQGVEQTTTYRKTFEYIPTH
ncbi:MAG: hypothetical protein LBI35_09480 [Burkholderiales bacterium]|jgi:hypothetical protein|nr:hypothetical protein [Burkholderiales bacterium]